MINLCDILEFVTEKNNILHLDIKPENIMVTKYGKELVLIDFGRSKRITKADRFAVSDLAKVNYNDDESVEKMYQYGTLGYAQISPLCSLIQAIIRILKQPLPMTAMLSRISPITLLMFMV